MQGFDIRRDQLFLAPELVGKRRLDDIAIQIDQMDQRAKIDHVLEQLALARVGPFIGAHPRDRNADDLNVLAAKFPLTTAVINQRAAW